MWKDVGGRRDTVHREICGVQDRSKRTYRNKGKASAKKLGERGGTRRYLNKGKASAKKQGERGGTLRYLREVKRRIWNENVFAPPNEQRKTLKLRFRVGDLDLPERRKRYASSREEEEIAQMCPCGRSIEYNSHSGKM